MVVCIHKFCICQILTDYCNCVILHLHINQLFRLQTVLKFYCLNDTHYTHLKLIQANLLIYSHCYK